MADGLDRVFRSGPAFWTGLGRSQQWLLLGLAAVVPGLFYVSLAWLSESPYVPLFASLPPEDAGTILAQLKAAKVPYKVAGAGEQVLVPADRAGELRLRFASQGLPIGGGVGFEVFDRSAFGMSDFAQRMSFQRALQGELARTIGQLRPVARARVHLVLPQPSVFTERERPASASVFLRLHPGGRLAPDQVRGIVHLVASSVEGLAPERVTVVDTAGRVLSIGGDPGTGQLSPRRLELKTAVEEGLERRVQSLLDSALGSGQAVIRVTAQLNFDQVERTEERFDPSSVVRQETRTVEKTKGTSATPNAPPPAAAAPPAASPTTTAATATTSNDASRESETVSYEISKVVARTLSTPGEIQRLSVAVLVNAGTKVVPGTEGKPESREPAPRSPQELEKIRRIVMGAVGFAQGRGDEVTVVEMPFDQTAVDRERVALEGPAPAAARQWLTTQAVALVGVVLFALLAFLWMVRLQSRRRGLAEVTRSLEEAETGAYPAAGPGQPAAASGGPQIAELPDVPEEVLRATRKSEDLKQQALALATAEPQATAQLLRAWLVKKKSLQPATGGSDAG